MPRSEYTKMVPRFVSQAGEGRLEIVGHGSREVVLIDSVTGLATLTDNNGKQQQFDGRQICVEDHSSELDGLDIEGISELQQTHGEEEEEEDEEQMGKLSQPIQRKLGRRNGQMKRKQRQGKKISMSSGTMTLGQGGKGKRRRGQGQGGRGRRQTFQQRWKKFKKQMTTSLVISLQRQGLIGRKNIISPAEADIVRQIQVLALPKVRKVKVQMMKVPFRRANSRLSKMEWQLVKRLQMMGMKGGRRRISQVEFVIVRNLQKLGAQRVAKQQMAKRRKRVRRQRVKGARAQRQQAQMAKDPYDQKAADPYAQTAEDPYDQTAADPYAPKAEDPYSPLKGPI